MNGREGFKKKGEDYTYISFSYSEDVIEEGSKGESGFFACACSFF